LAFLKKNGAYVAGTLQLNSKNVPITAKEAKPNRVIILLCTVKA
jgi:hypothetical protein